MNTGKEMERGSIDTKRYRYEQYDKISITAMVFVTHTQGEHT